jgi:Domain of unknown function (DUF3291)
MSDTWHLAQINIAKMIAPPGDPRVQEFIDNLDRVNALADASPGFVWRLIGDGNNAVDIQATIDPLLFVNMSVWEDAESLFEFVYRSSHTPVMGRRREWFERFDGAYMALWWIQAGTVPTVNDGLSRLWHIDRFGPTSHAFTFKVRFAEPGLIEPPVDMQPDPWCVGRA